MAQLVKNFTFLSHVHSDDVDLPLNHVRITL